MRRKERRRRGRMKDKLYDEIATISYRRLLEDTVDFAAAAFRYMYCRGCPHFRTCERPCPSAEERFKHFHFRLVAEKIALN